MMINDQINERMINKTKQVFIKRVLMIIGCVSLFVCCCCCCCCCFDGDGDGDGDDHADDLCGWSWSGLFGSLCQERRISYGLIDCEAAIRTIFPTLPAARFAMENGWVVIYCIYQCKQMCTSVILPNVNQTILQKRKELRRILFANSSCESFS